MSAAAFKAMRELHERVYEQRARTRLLDRLNGIIPSCYVCGRIQEPGQMFAEMIDGPICPKDLEAEMESSYAD